jgi:AraC family transcriptional regulator of adaptative response/methylated-DNA-[protein]-cysteine methyltransferase
MRMRRSLPTHDSGRNESARRRDDTRSGGAFALARGPLGWVLAAVGQAGEVHAVFLGDSRRELLGALRQRFPEQEWTDAARAGDAKHAGAAARALACVHRAIESPGRPETDGPLLAPPGTPFQRRVWSELQTLRPGECVSYGELARRAGYPRAVRAVAQACGANPIAVLIPCHRVIAASGALTGYHWGVERKRALLEREGAVPVHGVGAGQTSFSWTV